MAEVFATGIQMGESPRCHDDRFWMCDRQLGAHALVPFIAP